MVYVLIFSLIVFNSLAQSYLKWYVRFSKSSDFSLSRFLDSLVQGDFKLAYNVRFFPVSLCFSILVSLMQGHLESTYHLRLSLSFSEYRIRLSLSLYTELSGLRSEIWTTCSLVAAFHRSPLIFTKGQNSLLICIFSQPRDGGWRSNC